MRAAAPPAMSTRRFNRTVVPYHARVARGFRPGELLVSVWRRVASRRDPAARRFRTRHTEFTRARCVEG